jgi:hypothetical protein
MTGEQFAASLHREPFAPFAIHTADGRSVEVPRPDFVTLSPAGRTAIVFHANDADESYSVLDLLRRTKGCRPLFHHAFY